MMPPYVALHTICSIDLASHGARHSPQRSQARTRMRQIRAWLDRTRQSANLKLKSANIFVRAG